MNKHKPYLCIKNVIDCTTVNGNKCYYNAFIKGQIYYSDKTGLTNGNSVYLKSNKNFSSHFTEWEVPEEEIPEAEKNNTNNQDTSIKEYGLYKQDYYNNHPSKIECITIIEHYNFPIGNAIKYLWRAGLKKESGLTDKEKEIEDLKKAIYYINRQINILEKTVKEKENK